MNDMSDVIQSWLMRAAFWCAFSIFASNPSDAMARSRHGDTETGDVKLAFLSLPGAAADRSTRMAHCIRSGLETA
jgi:hypothetical protein